MLLSVAPATQRSKVFEFLNEELLAFFNDCVNAKSFTKIRNNGKARSDVWDNAPTVTKFRGLWNSIRILSVPERQSVVDSVSNSQGLRIFFGDVTVPFPHIPADILIRLKDLTGHLHENTSRINAVSAAAGEIINDYFHNFVDLNKNICCCCATDKLAQQRDGVDQDKQWRSGYDHLLAQKHYPIYSVHPDNLLPVCDTCNEKAKGSENLLVNPAGVRRKSAYPFDESLETMVSVELEVGDVGLNPKVTFNPLDADWHEKITTWNDVYEISSRVEGFFSGLAERISCDIDCFNGINDFRGKLNQKAINFFRYKRLDGWNLWRSFLYNWLSNQSDDFLQEVIDYVSASQDDQNFADVFGI